MKGKKQRKMRGKEGKGEKKIREMGEREDRNRKKRNEGGKRSEGGLGGCLRQGRKGEDWWGGGGVEEKMNGGKTGKWREKRDWEGEDKGQMGKIGKSKRGLKSIPRRIRTFNQWQPRPRSSRMSNKHTQHQLGSGISGTFISIKFLFCLSFNFVIFFSSSSNFTLSTFFVEL